MKSLEILGSTEERVDCLKRRRHARMRSSARQMLERLQRGRQRQWNLRTNGRPNRAARNCLERRIKGVELRERMIECSADSFDRYEKRVALSDQAQRVSSILQAWCTVRYCRYCTCPS